MSTSHCNFGLWDKLTPQVQTCLNLMQHSRIDPSKSAYETLYGPYDWNRYPLAPLGCKAVVYENGNTRGLWASLGVDGWYLGPLTDHYQCDLYFIPETRAYRISGSTKLISTTLPAAKPNATSTFPHAHGGINQLDSKCQRHTTRPPTHQAPSRKHQEDLKPNKCIGGTMDE